MSPALVQALQRLIVVFVVGGLAAVGANLTILNGTLGPLELIILPTLTAVIDGVLKYLGGPTIPVSNASLRASDNIDKPPFWAV